MKNQLFRESRNGKLIIMYFLFPSKLTEMHLATKTKNKSFKKGLQFYKKKNKLKSEIFNDKKSL